MSQHFKKYRYLGNVIPEVPIPWESHIINMLKELDKLVRPKFIPKFLLNIIVDIKLYTFQPVLYIKQIKQNFGTLKITGTFSKQAQEIVSRTISLCNNTCEFCGNTGTTCITIKSWIRNVCSTCQETKKYGSNI